jgi:N-acetylglutamate synthase-like GNAT family acetyltransferase
MEHEPTTEMSIRQGTLADRSAVLELIRPYVERKKLLHRTIDELDDLLLQAFVAELKQQIIGFVALEIYSPKLAEIRSLVVAAPFQNRGVGQRLVDVCVAKAREEGVLEVMAISSSEPFFRSCGFDFTLPEERKAFFRQTGDRDWRSRMRKRD